MIFLCNFMTFLHIEKYTLTYIITHEVYNEKIIIIFRYFAFQAQDEPSESKQTNNHPIKLFNYKQADDIFYENLKILLIHNYHIFRSCQFISQNKNVRV